MESRLLVAETRKRPPRPSRKVAWSVVVADDGGSVDLKKEREVDRRG